MKSKGLSLLCCLVYVAGAMAQRVVVHPQQSFPESVKAGGYSGITWMGDNRYAVVSDNHQLDGFYIFDIPVDSAGCISQVREIGFYHNSVDAKDNEGIAWFPGNQTLFISNETENQVREFRLDGSYTGRKLQLPQALKGASRAYGIEALTYNALTHRFWLTAESTLSGDGPRTNDSNGVQNLLRLYSFDDNLKPVGMYAYLMESPDVEFPTQRYAMGVSALTALDDGGLLVLEREMAVPESKLGSFVTCRIFKVHPDKCNAADSQGDIKNVKPLEKTLLTEWTTAIGLLEFSIANYEGMCLGPKLPDGGQVLLLLSDSQNQYAGILADWFRSVVIYEP